MIKNGMWVDIMLLMKSDCSGSIWNNVDAGNLT